jgi:thiamine pyrophosphate-dependent acetolactate synthase large subunit-like protein
MIAATVTEQLAAAIAAEGCRHMFTLMGAGNLWLIHALATQQGVEIHHLRHENGAVGAADGAARSTGEVGWCTVTQGPGFTNTITALLTASRGRSPVVLIVADSSNLDPARFPFAGGVQGLSPELILEPLGIDWVRADPDRAGGQLREVAQRARTERRTIAFIMPAGLDRIVAEPDETIPEPASTSSSPRAALDPVALERAAELRRRAERPVIAVGAGVIAAGAGAEVAELAEALLAPVVTSVPASGALGDHPAVVGQLGGFSVGAAERCVREADLVLAIGISLNPFQTRSGSFFADIPLIRIDVDPMPVTGPEPSAMLVGDARTSTRELREHLASNGLAPRDRPHAAPAAAEAFVDVSEPGAIDPRALAVAFDRALPVQRRIIVDNGHFGAFPMIYLRHRAARSLVWLPDFGAVGSALAAAFASATVDPGTRSVLFIGDCGLYMTLGDLETAIRERTPLIIVCMNDGAAGSELVHMHDWGVPPEQAIFGYADLAALAQGMGAQARLVREARDVAPALDAWDPGAGPLFLDCHVSRAVRSPIYDHV